MAYAVFQDDDKMGRTFSTREEALEKADEAGLVEMTDGESVLEDDLVIKACPPDCDTRSDDELDWAMNPKQLPNDPGSKDGSDPSSCY
jgi:hypothetical protein